MLIQLPNGLLDGVDLFNYAEIDELRGKQQNYLVDKELVVGNVGHIPKILEDMILSLQTKEGLKWQGKMSDAVWKLPSGDIETVLIKIRENTYGPKFYHFAKCADCGLEQKNLKLELDKLAVDVMPLEEMLKPKVVMLPKMKVEAELKPLYLRDLFDAIKITNNQQDKLVTTLSVVSLKRLGNKQKITPEDIEDMPATDLQYLQSKLAETKLEGSIDTDLQIFCPKCDKDFEVKLNCYDPSFFDPTRGSTT